MPGVPNPVRVVWTCPRCNRPLISSLVCPGCGQPRPASMKQSRPETVDDPASKMVVAPWVLPALAFITSAIIVVATLPVSATTAGATAVVAIGVMALPGSSQAAEPPPADQPASNPGAGVTGMVPSDGGPSIQTNNQPAAVDPGPTTSDDDNSTTTTTTTTTTSTGDGHTGGDYDDGHDPGIDDPDPPEHDPEDE